jgi:putative transposase
MKTKSGAYYYCLPYEKKLEKLPPTLGGAVSMDPGVRTFQTTYHPQEMLESEHVNSRIHAKFKRIDKLNRILPTVSDNKTRWNIRKKLRRLFADITEIVRDMQWKAASWLTDRYDTIIIPKFSGKKIAEKYKNHALNRIMLALSHFTFRQRLKHMCNMKGRTYIECTEEYTSKTCGKCGYQKEDLKASKVYRCDRCKFVYGRDANGARNIMIKVLTEYLDKQGYRYNPIVAVSGA